MICKYGYGQEKYVKLIKKNYPREVLIEEGTLIGIKRIEDRKLQIKGKLKILNDSIVMVGKDSVFINNICLLRVKSKGRTIGGYSIGTIGFIACVTGLVTTIIVFSEVDDLMDFFIAFIFSGLPMAGGGAVLTGIGYSMSTGKKYTINKYWDVEIVIQE